jgi:hypothetical protein
MLLSCHGRVGCEGLARDQRAKRPSQRAVLMVLNYGGLGCRQKAEEDSGEHTAANKVSVS